MVPKVFKNVFFFVGSKTWALLLNFDWLDLNYDCPNISTINNLKIAVFFLGQTRWPRVEGGGLLRQDRHYAQWDELAEKIKEYIIHQKITVIKVFRNYFMFSSSRDPDKITPTCKLLLLLLLKGGILIRFSGNHLEKPEHHQLVIGFDTLNTKGY